MQEDYTANLADYNDGLPPARQKRSRSGSAFGAAAGSPSVKNCKTPAVPSLAGGGAGGFVSVGGELVAVPEKAPRSWVEWEVWGRSLDTSSGAAVSHPALALMAPVGVDAETGERLETGRAARSVRSAVRKMGAVAAKSGVFKNNAPEPACAAHSITAAQTTNEKEARGLIDYLGTTFHGEHAFEQACLLFGADLDWTPLEHGGYKYARCVRRGDVSIYYGGEYNHGGVMREHDTAFVVASGKGCRQLEHEGLVNGFGSLDGQQSPWQAFLGDLLALGCTFPRLDVAIDDREGLLNLDTIEASLEAGNCCTRAKTYRRWPERSTVDGSKLGDAITIGNRQSLMFVRIYNKQLEQIVKGEITPPAEGDPSVHWLRCELEAKNEKAFELAKAIAQRGMWAVAAALWCVVDFKDPDDVEAEARNRYRRKTVGWWDNFISVTSKLPLTLAPKVRTLEKVVKWLQKTVAPSLALVDCLPEEVGAAIWQDLLKSGGERLRGTHVAMLKQFSGVGWGRSGDSYA